MCEWPEEGGRKIVLGVDAIEDSCYEKRKEGGKRMYR